MARAVIIVLDSVGVGGAPDAAAFGDLGADTLGHIAERCAFGDADVPHGRSGALRLPHLTRLGLGAAARLATGCLPPGLDGPVHRTALYGTAREVSRGKDTPSGHWEIAGVPVTFAWGGFPRSQPSFPPELVGSLCRDAWLPGILGDCHASGTDILVQIGGEHMRTGKPICYTSADSVFQIAAHEETFGLERLLDVCRVARRLVDPLHIGRVIARPFVGDPEGGFTRTGNRRDFSVLPPSPTLLDRAIAAGREVVTVGKVGDIFAHAGTGREMPASGNEAVVDKTLAALEDLPDGGLVFSNLVDFDSLYGHRRDVAGYAGALEAFDARVPELVSRLRPADLLIITADHGCDPTWQGTDHTREQVPVLVVGTGLPAGSIGQRATFADIGASVARHLGLPPLDVGTAFLEQTATSPTTYRR